MNVDDTNLPRPGAMPVTRRTFLASTGQGTLAATIAALMPAGLAYPEGTNRTIRMAAVVTCSFPAAFSEPKRCGITSVGRTADYALRWVENGHA